MIAFDLPLDAIMSFASATVLRATAVLIGGLLLAMGLRFTSAAARHALWSVIVGALVILPALPLVLPALPIPVPSPAVFTSYSILPSAASKTTAHPALQSHVREGTPGEAAIAVAPDRADTPALDPSSVLEPAGNPVARNIGKELTGPGAGSHPAMGLLLLLWLVVGLAVAAPVAVALRRASMLRDSATPLGGTEWANILERAGSAVGLRTTVSLRMSPKVRTPMAGGLLHPFVLVPSEARSWSDELREIVLLHELTHVKRRDVLRQVAGRLVLSIYWFHPLAWRAVRMASLAREQACDEAVLALGHRPSTYAARLLELAEPGPLPLPALSLFDRSHMEQRIMGILRFKPRSRSPGPVLVASILGGAWALMAAAAAPIERRPATDILESTTVPSGWRIVLMDEPVTAGADVRDSSGDPIASRDPISRTDWGRSASADLREHSDPTERGSRPQTRSADVRPDAEESSAF